MSHAAACTSVIFFYHFNCMHMHVCVCDKERHEEVVCLGEIAFGFSDFDFQVCKQRDGGKLQSSQVWQKRDAEMKDRLILA